MVTCLIADTRLAADPGVVSWIPARSHNLVEIDHEIISTVILLPSAYCQLQAKYVHKVLVNHFIKLAQDKSVNR